MRFLWAFLIIALAGVILFFNAWAMLIVLAYSGGNAEQSTTTFLTLVIVTALASIIIVVIPIGPLKRRNLISFAFVLASGLAMGIGIAFAD